MYRQKLGDNQIYMDKIPSGRIWYQRGYFSGFYISKFLNQAQVGTSASSLDQSCNSRAVKYIRNTLISPTLQPPSHSCTLPSLVWKESAPHSSPLRILFPSWVVHLKRKEWPQVLSTCPGAHYNIWTFLCIWKKK